MNEDRLARLEERYAWLERHVLEQDRAMAAMGEEIRRLRRELSALQERLRAAGGGGGAAEGPEPEEPPPPQY